MVLMPVRNPIDNYGAWSRYMRGQTRPQEFLRKWSELVHHWPMETRDIPLLVFRYEDLMRDTEGTLRHIISSLPGNWTWSHSSIERAVREHAPLLDFEASCGHYFQEWTPGELDLLSRYHGTMQRFGYDLVSPRTAATREEE